MGPRIAIVLLVGCRFGAPGPAGSSDQPDATAADALAPATLCNVAAMPGATPAGASLGDPGTSHGNLQPDLACAAGELPVGVGFYTTTNPRPEGGPGPGERVGIAITVQCGTITRQPDHQLAITPGSRTDFNSSECPGWTPTTLAPLARCPPNTVLVGLTGNGGIGSLFNTIRLTCAALTPAGEVGTATSSVAVVDTGNYTNNPQTAACPADRAVVGFALRANCGIDKLAPVCAPLRCN